MTKSTCLIFTRAAIYTSVASMLILVFGTTMVEDWSALPSQFIHIGFLAICLQFISSNSWCLDKKI